MPEDLNLMGFFFVLQKILVNCQDPIVVVGPCWSLVKIASEREFQMICMCQLLYVHSSSLKNANKEIKVSKMEILSLG